MPFTLAFSITQGVDSTSATLIDASTGSNPAIVTRRIYITDASGTPVVPTGTTTTYIDFPFSDGASKVLNVLPIDAALSISLRYMDVAGTALYSLSQNYSFTGNDNLFDYGLTQQLVGNQSILQNSNYLNNRFTFRMFIDAASEAVITGNDVNSSQFLLNLAEEMKNKQTKFF